MNRGMKLESQLYWRRSWLRKALKDRFLPVMVCFIREYAPPQLWLVESIPRNKFENVVESMDSRPMESGWCWSAMALSDSCSLKSPIIASEYSQREVPETPRIVPGGLIEICSSSAPPQVVVVNSLKELGTKLLTEMTPVAAPQLWNELKE